MNIETHPLWSEYCETQRELLAALAERDANAPSVHDGNLNRRIATLSGSLSDMLREIRADITRPTAPSLAAQRAEAHAQRSAGLQPIAEPALPTDDD